MRHIHDLLIKQPESDVCSIWEYKFNQGWVVDVIISQIKLDGHSAIVYSTIHIPIRFYSKSITKYLQTFLLTHM